MRKQQIEGGRYEKGDGDCLAHRARLTAGNESRYYRPDQRAKPPSCVQQPYRRGAIAANREDLLAINRQEQQHSSSQTPAALDQQESHYTRLGSEISGPFDEVGHTRG